MGYQIITITGKLMEVGDVYELTPGRKAQRIIVEVSYNDARVKTDYFAVFAYGLDIPKLWEHHNDRHPPHSIKITAKLNGRMKQDRNTLTLSFKSVIWIYD